ncbi:MAG: hypothetical protein ACLVFZ_12910, partial [Parasutterella sp.]|uniref:hypothetical protein n=1 Tax=Parasutterella sp. TaxID=2049037 RepID=UPI00399B5332
EGSITDKSVYPHLMMDLHYNGYNLQDTVIVTVISLKLRTVFAMVRTPILTGANSSLNTVRNAASN